MEKIKSDSYYIGYSFGTTILGQLNKIENEEVSVDLNNEDVEALEQLNESIIISDILDGLVDGADISTTDNSNTILLSSIPAILSLIAKQHPNAVEDVSLDGTGGYTKPLLGKAHGEEGIEMGVVYSYDGVHYMYARTGIRNRNKIYRVHM